MRNLLPLVLFLFFLSTLASGAEVSLNKKILQRARQEVEKKTEYRDCYYQLKYPGGDVPAELGVCTDLVIRSFRHAGIDLQKLLHEDRVKNPQKYPTHIWNNRPADKNIDHRRCQNMVVFFERFAQKRTEKTDRESLTDWQAGDVVFFVKPKQKYPWHVAIVSDRKTPEGVPKILHLFPPYAHEADLLDYGPIHSRFRWIEKKDNDTKPA